MRLATPSVFALWCSLAEPSFPHARVEPSPLELSSARVLDLDSYEITSMRIRAPSGAFLQVRFESSGLPARAQITAPNGEVVAQLDRLPRETSSLSWMVDTGGDYVLTVASLTSLAVRFTVELVALRPSEDGDPALLEALGRIADATALENEGSRGSLLSAIDMYEQAITKLPACDPASQRSAVLRRIAAAENSLGRLDDSAKTLLGALAKSRGCRAPRAEALALIRLAEVRTLEGEYEKARACLEEAQELVEPGGDDFLRAEIELVSAELDSYQGEIERAAPHYEAALLLYQGNHDPVGRARIFLNLTYDHIDSGNPELALETGRAALAVFRQARDRRSVARTLRILGVAQQNLGDSQASLDRFLEARDILEPMGDAKELTALFNSLSEVHFEAGSFAAAKEYAKEGLARAQEAGIPWFQAISNRLLGRALLALREHDDAIAHFRSALAIDENLRQTRSIAIVQRDLATALRASGQMAEAASLLESSLELAREQGSRYQEARFLNDLGEVLLVRGEATRALSAFEASLTLHERIGSALDQVPVRLNIARALSSADRLDDAAHQCELAISRAEELRGGFASYELRASYLSSIHDLYGFYIDLLMRLHRRAPDRGYDGRALRTSELARARTLTDVLRQSRVAVSIRTAPEWRRRELELSEEIDRLARHVAAAAGSSDEEAAEMAGRYTRLRADYDQIRSSNRASDPRFAALTDPPLMDAGTMRSSLLDADTALLEYFLGTERSYVWLLTRDGLSYKELPGKDTLNSASRRFYELVTAPLPRDGEGFDEYLHRSSEAQKELPAVAEMLSRLLLPPQVATLDRRRILLVTDGSLDYVPFGALPVVTPGSGKTTLLGEHELVRIPSAASLLFMREDAGDPRRKLDRALVVADPVYSLDDPRVRRHTPAFELEKPFSPSVARPLERRVVRGPSLDIGRLPRLLGSAGEAQDIEERLGTGNVDVLQGFDARRDRLPSTFADYSIIHFATHSLVNDTLPELSAILLSDLDENGRPVDGFLMLSDIYDMELPMELVVLSACDTALGRELRGEGMVGLVGGFFHAGTKRIVASLWKVDDRATRELMRHFYDGLSTGMTPAAALRRAKLAMFHDSRWSAPYFWSGFEIHGEWR